MMIIHGGIKTNINQLKLIILEHKEQLRRMKIIDTDSYPIIVNIVNQTGIEDDWELDIDVDSEDE